jgi:predicted Fe-Mo cluster-binding NifX family protein
MIIAIPTVNRQISKHFGHCSEFALLQIEDATRTIRSVTYATPPPHEPGVLPRWLRAQGTDVVLASGMGERAQSLFAQDGIRVVIGASGNTPEELAAAYLDHTLASGPNPCDHQEHQEARVRPRHCSDQ